MRTVALLLSVVHLSLTLDILVYLTVVGKSHLDFAASLVDKLTARGHNVDFLLARLNSAVNSNGTKNARHVLSAGFPGPSPWNRLEHMTSPFELQSYEKAYIATTWGVFNRITDMLCEHVVADAVVADHLSRHHYDVALVTSYDACPLALMHHHGIHRVITYSSLPTCHFEQVFSGIPNLPVYETDTLHSFFSFDPSKVTDRLRNFLRILQNVFIDGEKQSTDTDRITRKRYGQDFPSIEELGKKVFYDMSNSHALLEEPRVMSRRSKYIGGIALQKAAPLDDKNYTRILAEAKKGVVLISFGSQVPAANFPPHVVAAFLHAIGQFPNHHFIWKYDLPLPNKPKNLHTFDWVPQRSLLQQKEVVGFVSHMGMNSFTEATFAGVPMIAIPLFADQLHSGRNIVRLGTGVRLPKTTITNETMAKAMHELLHNDRYYTRAKEVARMLEAYPDKPERIFVEAVEFAAQVNDLNKITYLPGGNVSFVAQHGYDLVIIAYTALLIVLYVTYRLLVRLTSVVFSAKSKLD